ncbi:hypothetical protein [Rhizobium giardinii]|jgi:hypothetical protein|uniref:Uncharacterized protein n=1 Tax=Rhizobium giardinii TaxID=56731 RepID=A0A7W8XC28_9HYPH|nr:hypothetical protein [Rhizobium giardinii]MBB5538473.1 hypothetical protein [Rhizobium giardinii]
MQERYLGDSHDYAKYSLLRHLGNVLGGRVGLNWYLTRHDQVDKLGNNDGEKRHHVTSKTWRGWEIDLLRQLQPLQTPSERRLSRVAELGVLPQDTIYFDDYVPQLDRAIWHRTGRELLKSADIVFLDPDNGFEVPSATGRTRPKYALYSEAIDFLNDNKIVVAIQFARQCAPVERALTVRSRLSALAERDIKTPIIRARLAPNLLFVTLAPQEREAEVSAAINTFGERREKIELID